MLKPIVIATAAVLTLSACASHPDRANTDRGVAIGAIGGAILGNVLGGGNRTGGAVLGAIVGATAGGLIGQRMDRQEADLRRQMAGTGVEVDRRGDTLFLQAPEQITFATDRADITPRFSVVLDQLAASLRQYPGTVIQIEGHTDTTGNADYNQRLSENRANSVRSYLIQRGVAPDRMVAVGYGQTRPLADNRTVAGRAMNRRVEIIIVPRDAR